MGNSEVGHLNLGAGAVVKQDLTRIDDAVADGALRRERGAARRLRAAREPRRLHLIGLVSDGGVHSELEHLEALIELAAEPGRRRTSSSTPSPTAATRSPTGGAGYLAELEGWLRRGRRADRHASSAATTRWTATSAGSACKLAYDAIVHGRAAAPRRRRAAAAVAAAYERGETDEFVTPTVVGDEAAIRPGDVVIVFNFRPDRMREITAALADPDFDGLRPRRRRRRRA